MKALRKIWALMLYLSLTVSMTACSDDDNENGNETNTNNGLAMIGNSPIDLPYAYYEKDLNSMYLDFLSFNPSDSITTYSCVEVAYSTSESTVKAITKDSYFIRITEYVNGHQTTNIFHKPNYSGSDLIITQDGDNFTVTIESAECVNLYGASATFSLQYTGTINKLPHPNFLY